MHSLRYLNTVLTVVAILLGLQLWTNWNTATTNGSVPDMVAQAHAQGLPDAGAQRKEMIAELKGLRKQMGELQTQLSSGKVRVQIQEPPKDE